VRHKWLFIRCVMANKVSLGGAIAATAVFLFGYMPCVISQEPWGALVFGIVMWLCLEFTEAFASTTYDYYRQASDALVEEGWIREGVCERLAPCGKAGVRMAINDYLKGKLVIF